MFKVILVQGPFSEEQVLLGKKISAQWFIVVYCQMLTMDISGGSASA